MHKFTTSDPTVSEFKKHIDSYASEIGCDGDQISSHKLKSSVSVQTEDPNDDNEYELVGLDISRLMGCGCWDGIVLMINKKNGDKSNDK